MLTNVVQPLLAAIHLTNVVSAPIELAEYLVIGIAQIFVIGIVFMPLEIIAPAEKWSDRRYARVDVVHTCINLLGIVPFGTFLVLEPISEAFTRMLGQNPSEASWHLGNFFPWFDHHPFLLFLTYFVLLDFASWIMHRLQHKLGWWWALHSLHHSQRQMSRWSDDRGSVLDSLLQSLFISSFGIFIGVAPVEYGLILFFGKMVENLSHANTRLHFGPLFDKILIDPRFHRQHHMMADAAEPDLHDCNFGFIFPYWDILFRTALYDGKLRPTGVDDPEVDADNMKGWWGQQVASLARMFRAFGIHRPRSSESLQTVVSSESESVTVHVAETVAERIAETRLDRDSPELEGVKL